MQKNIPDGSSFSAVCAWTASVSVFLQPSLSLRSHNLHNSAALNMDRWEIKANHKVFLTFVLWADRRPPPLSFCHCHDDIFVRLEFSALIFIFLDSWRNEMSLQATCHDHCNSPLRSLAISTLDDLYISVLQLSRASGWMVIGEGSSRQTCPKYRRRLISSFWTTSSWMSSETALMSMFRLWSIHLMLLTSNGNSKQTISLQCVGGPRSTEIIFGLNAAPASSSKHNLLETISSEPWKW